MSRAFPYVYISCPCSSQTAVSETTTSSRRASYRPLNDEADDRNDEDAPLNPHDLRANFSLYPYEHLLYCDECHEIRCPRCWTEEITTWYCPICLFEVPSSIVKTDGNR